MCIWFSVPFNGTKPICVFLLFPKYNDTNRHGNRSAMYFDVYTSQIQYGKVFACNCSCFDYWETPFGVSVLILVIPLNKFRGYSSGLSFGQNPTVRYTHLSISLEMIFATQCKNFFLQFISSCKKLPPFLTLKRFSMNSPQIHLEATVKNNSKHQRCFPIIISDKIQVPIVRYTHISSCNCNNRDAK